MRFEVFKGKSGWFARLVARNGQTFVVSESYTRKADAIRAAKRIKKVAAEAEIEVIE